MDEEGYGIGAKALLDTEYAGSDAMLLGEPYFGCEIGGPDEALPIGLTGKVLYKLTVTGRMAHAFYPERGVNAVEDAGKILAALDQLKIGQHPEFGSGNYSTLKVEGGYKEYAVVVPETCEIIISRLTVPGETRDTPWPTSAPSSTRWIWPATSPSRRRLPSTSPTRWNARRR